MSDALQKILSAYVDGIDNENGSQISELLKLSNLAHWKQVKVQNVAPYLRNVPELWDAVFACHFEVIRAMVRCFVSCVV